LIIRVAQKWVKIKHKVNDFHGFEERSGGAEFWAFAAETTTF